MDEIILPKTVKRNTSKSRTIKRTFENRWSRLDLKDLARQHTQRALETLVEIMTDGDSPSNARINAAQQLLDRGWGKPTTHNEVSVDAYDRMTDEELIHFIKDSLPLMTKTIEHIESSNEED